MNVEQRQKAIDQLQQAIDAIKAGGHYGLIEATGAAGAAIGYITVAIHTERFEAGLDRGVNMMWGKK